MSLSSLSRWLLCLLFLVPSLHAAEVTVPTLASDPAGYAPAASCLGCHAEQARDWKDSDHDWAMREAKEGNVLGNFAGASFNDAGLTTRFFRKGGQYFVNTEGADGKLADFRILYTFGYQPLQQYLVAFPGGRLQALTVAWDSRPASAGGQRWFSLYPGQRFAPTDALHWTGRYQNWNAMCADCHSTNLLKGYDAKNDSFTTTWHEQNVGCQSCHGPGLAHVDWAGKAGAVAGKGAPAAQLGLPVDLKALDSRERVEHCAYCHSRRQSLGSGAQPGHPLLDSALPASLRPDLYHADGQSLGEVYEYGSFTQSKMYAAGVACTDCHNPHSTRVKIEGNGLCQQCHSEQPPARFPSLRAKNYDSPEHHHHQPGSAGAQCVNCHMPQTTYMQVDPRRDHSLRIPRPDLAEKTASPDACTRCHAGKTPAWASKAIDGWFAQPQRAPHYGELFHGLNQGQGDALVPLVALIGDLGKPAIVRATAAERLTQLGAPALPSLEKALGDDSALVRAYAIPGFASLPPVQRVQHLLPLLDDASPAVRDEALRALAGIPLIALPEARRAEFSQRLAEYERRLRANADLPGNRLNLAVLLERTDRQLEAIEQYRQALRLDPYFSPARVNLVSLANGILRQDEAEQTLREGLALRDVPQADRGNLAYMLALLLVERGRAEEAVQWLDEAAEVLPTNPRIRYNQGLLLLQLQRRDQAQAALEAGLEQAPADADLLYALIYLHGSTGEREAATRYWYRLQAAAPGDPRLAPLRGQLGIQ
ncbi:MAG: cytochrome c3 family protein [Pseudomonas sp.]